jgi:hypothetical protein
MKVGSGRSRKGQTGLVLVLSLTPVRRDPPEPMVKMARMVPWARLARKVTPVRRVRRVV